MLELPFIPENGWPSYTHRYSKSEYERIFPPYSFNDFYGGGDFGVYHSEPYYIHFVELDNFWIVTTNFIIETKEEPNGLRIIYPFPNPNPIKVD